MPNLPHLFAQFEVSFSSYHPGGCNMSLADGSTRFVGETIDMDAWRALASRAGGEVVGAP